MAAASNSGSPANNEIYMYAPYMYIPIIINWQMHTTSSTLMSKKYQKKIAN